MPDLIWLELHVATEGFRNDGCLPCNDPYESRNLVDHLQQIMAPCEVMAPPGLSIELKEFDGLSLCMSSEARYENVENALETSIQPC